MTKFLLRFATLCSAILLTLVPVALEAQAPQQPPAQQPPAPQATQPPTQPQQPAPVPIGNLSLQGASLTEVIDQLAQRLGMNYILDPRVKGSVSISTYGETRTLDARNLLEMILRINGFGMVQEGAVWRIVPMADVARHAIRPEINAKDIPDDDQLILNMVFLKYMTVAEISEILKTFSGENAVIYPYPPANLLFILDSRRSMRRTMEMIGLFDSDSFAGDRVRLFELANARPTDLQKELEQVLKAISADGKTLTVRFMAVDRLNMLVAVAQNPGIFDKVEEWIKKLDIPITVSTSVVADTHVYRVRYGRAQCLAQAITQLYFPLNGYGGGGYGGYPGGYGQGGIPYGGGGNFGAFNAYNSGGFGGGYGGGGGGGGGGGYGSTNAFNDNFGGNNCGGQGAGGGGYGGGGYGGGGYGGGGGYPGGYGYPSFGGFAAQTPVGGAQGAVPGAAGQAAQQQPTGPNGEPLPTPPRVVANPLDNSLLIQADAVQYQAILKLLKELDIAPRQILLEAKIYQVDMSGAFASGISASLQAKTGRDLRPLATLADGLSTFTAGMLVGHSRELLAFLSLQENSTHAHVVSEPSLIATDSIPATINVGTQVPVLTSQVASPIQVSGTNTVNQQIAGRNTGVTLNVNARVNPSGIVTLMVNQEISKPSGSSGSLTPSFSQQVVQTQLTVQDGDTIAIGGIIAENSSDTSQGIPLLHKIPVLGAAFGSKSYTHSRSEFIIFMTPHVIYDNNDLQEASDELIARVKKLRKYIKP